MQVAALKAHIGSSRSEKACCCAPKSMQLARCLTPNVNQFVLICNTRMTIHTYTQYAYDDTRV